MKNYDVERLIARYQEKPVSIGKIAEEFNLCKITVSKILKASNINLWSRQDLNIGELKIDYFESIDTEIKAYLLGLFAADGCIYSLKSGKLFTIQMKSEDAYMIEFIKNELQAPRKIVTDKRDDSRSITIINNNFVENLIENGVAEGKSERFFPNLKEEFIPHYIRGLFDGDGSITIRKAHSYGKAIRCCVVLLAHSKLISKLRDYLEKKLNVSHLTFCSDGGDAYSVRYSSRRDFITVTNFIYSNANIYLKRKFGKYQKALLYLC